MRDDPNKFLTGLSGRGILAALAAGAALVGAAAGAEAGEGHGKKHRHHHHYYAPGYVMVPPGHVRYYAPAPVVYPAPVMYGPAYPAYDRSYDRSYGPSGGSMSFGLNLPLH